MREASSASVLAPPEIPSSFRVSALSPGQRRIKRLVDVVASAILLPLSSPLWLAIALAIRLDSRGPIIFRQQRVGEGGRLFTMLKFRTMVEDAESCPLPGANGHGPVPHKLRDDPRLTRVGRYLRTTSLDELPQLVNVLGGDMSLVGPRPELPWIVRTYEPWQYRRFTVPQGLTGWWQISGRSDRPMHLHTDDDLHYIDHFSLWLDLVILVRTVRVVLSRSGAF